MGNRHLQNEVSTIFQRITQKITRGMSRVVILIDWSAYHASRFQLLRASLACDGRSLPLMSCVVPSSQTANADVNGARNILAAGHAVLACGGMVQSGRPLKQEPDAEQSAVTH